MPKTKSQKSKIQYSFPTVSPCPRCRGTQTRAVSTQGKVQYRVCQAPICRNRYTVIGTKVEVPAAPERSQNVSGKLQ